MCSAHESTGSVSPALRLGLRLNLAGMATGGRDQRIVHADSPEINGLGRARRVAQAGLVFRSDAIRRWQSVEVLAGILPPGTARAVLVAACYWVSTYGLFLRRWLCCEFHS